MGGYNSLKKPRLPLNFVAESGKNELFLGYYPNILKI